MPENRPTGYGDPRYGYDNDDSGGGAGGDGSDTDDSGGTQTESENVMPELDPGDTGENVSATPTYEDTTPQRTGDTTTPSTDQSQQSDGGSGGDTGGVDDGSGDSTAATDTQQDTPTDNRPTGYTSNRTATATDSISGGLTGRNEFQNRQNQPTAVPGSGQPENPVQSGTVVAEGVEETAEEAGYDVTSPYSTFEATGSVPDRLATDSGVRDRADQLESQVLERNPGLTDDDVSVNLVEENGSTQLRAEITDAATREQAAAAFSQQSGMNVSADDIVLTADGPELSREAEQEITAEQATTSIAQDNPLQSEQNQPTRMPVENEVTADEINLTGDGATLEVQEQREQAAQQFQEQGLDVSAEDVAVSGGSARLTDSAQERVREQAVASQLGLPSEVVEQGDDFTVGEDGRVSLTAEGRQEAIEGRVAEQGYIMQSPQSATAFGAEVGPEAERQQIQSVEQLQFNDEGELTGVEPARTLSEQQDVIYDRVGGGPVGAVLAGSYGVSKTSADIASENIVQPATDIGGDLAEYAARQRLGGMPILTPSGPSTIGTDARASAGDILRSPSDEITRSSYIENLGEGVGQTAGLAATAPAQVGGLAVSTGRMAGESADFAASEISEEGVVDGTGSIAAATAEETVDYGERTAASALNNPGQTIGALAGSAAIMGGAAALSRGSSGAVTGRAGTVARYGIQPGEELVGLGGNRITRAVAGERAAARAFPNNEPVFMSEETAIRAGQRVSGGLQTVASGTASRVRSGLGRVRSETPVSVEVDPNQQFLEVGDDVPARTRRALRTGPGRVARGSASAGADAAERLVGRTSRYEGTPEGRLQQEFLPGASGGMLDTDISAGIRSRLPSFPDRRPNAELADDVATAADEPEIQSQGTVGDPTDVSTGAEGGGDYLDELYDERGTPDVTDEPAIRSQNVPDPQDITVPRDSEVEGSTEDPTLRMGEHDPLGIESGGPSPRYKLRESGDGGSGGPGFLRRGRQELTAARFALRERAGSVSSALSDVRDITIRVGDPDRPSIEAEGGDTDIPPLDEPEIRSQTDDPLNLGDADETPLEGGASPGAGGGGGGGAAMLQGETGVATETVYADPEVETATEASATGPTFESAGERPTVRTQPADRTATSPTLDVGTTDRIGIDSRVGVGPRTGGDVDSMLNTETATDVRTGLDTESEVRTDVETETETRLELRQELETENETEFELELRGETRRESESEAFPEQDERDRRRSYDPFASDETFGSGIASAEDVLGGGNGDGGNLL